LPHEALRGLTYAQNYAALTKAHGKPEKSVTYHYLFDFIDFYFAAFCGNV
jgi:hypothetical protein